MRWMHPSWASRLRRACCIFIRRDYKVAALDGLMRNKATLDALTASEDPRRIAEDWQDALKGFQAMRAKYLLY